MRLVWQIYFQDLHPDPLERGFRSLAFPSSNYAFISVMYNLTCFFDIKGVRKMSVSSMHILTCLCNEIAVCMKSCDKYIYCIYCFVIEQQYAKY